MKTSMQNIGMRQTAIALAVLAAFGPACAEDSVEELITPESTVSVGVGAVSGDSKDRALFGQYNGMRKDSAYGLLDIDYIKRDNDSGTWTQVKGSNLGLGNREISVLRQKQGDWKASAEYSELERVYPRTINTGMTGVGTTTPVINRLATPGTGSDYDLKTTRQGTTLSLEKWLSKSFQFQAVFKNEDKDGARLWGRGYDCAAYVCNGANTLVKNAILLVPEPINSNTKQIDAKVNFHDEKLFLSVGYYGSYYTNSNGSLNPTVPNLFNRGAANPFTAPAAAGYPAVAGGMSLQDVLQSPMALAPDNQAHKIYFDGNYAFTPKTKATFKYAYTHATQNEDFAAMGLSGAPAGVSNLGASVDSSLAQFGFTTRPIDKLSLLANVRYENKDDKTPSALYNVENGVFWNNNHTSSSRLNGKLEASYQLPANYRVTLGTDYSSIEREVPTSLADENVAGLSALRAKNSETGYRLELRRNLSETLNGAISYSTSKRGGSDWTSLNTNASAALRNLYCGGLASCYGQELPASSIIGLSGTSIFPMSMADVERDKWKLMADWSPIERLSLQFSLEDGKDKNTTDINPVAGGKGWRDTGFKLYSIDVSFALNDNWNLTGYASYGDQTQHINHSTGYMLGLNDRNDALGIGVNGKLSSKLQVGANLSYLNDVNKYGIDAAQGYTAATNTASDPSANNLAQAAIGLPNVTFRNTTLSLFGKYALQKNADIRVDLIHQRAKLTEWTWESNGVPFAYADNTTVGSQATQNVSFIGVRYIYRFQ